MLKTVVPYTSEFYGRAIVMPNLVPPVTTVAAAIAYRQRIMDAVPAGHDFTPLMTCYLTDSLDPAELERGFNEGVFTAAKLYPANATTNSGVSSGIGRVELGGGEHPFVKAAFQLRWVERVCQIAGHQRGKIMPGRHGVHNALAVSDSRRDGGDRRHQIRHHDRPAIKLTGIRHDGFQHIVIAQMDMPVGATAP